MTVTHRLAVISDVHADVHALGDALTQIERLGCDGIVCAGDLVDYGLFPEETLTLLRERRIPCIGGNHDRWAIGRGRADGPRGGAGRTAGRAHDAAGWDLSRAAIDFLAALPTAWDAVIEGVRVALRHGTPRSDMDGIYPDLAGPDDVLRWLEQAVADVLIVGHTHLAFELRTLGGGLVVNPGALLRQTAGGAPIEPMLYDPDRGAFIRSPAPGGGTFGVLELPVKRFTVYSASDGVKREIIVATAGVKDRRGGD